MLGFSTKFFHCKTWGLRAMQILTSRFPQEKFSHFTPKSTTFHHRKTDSASPFFQKLTIGGCGIFGGNVSFHSPFPQKSRLLLLKFITKKLKFMLPQLKLVVYDEKWSDFWLELFGFVEIKADFSQ